MSGFYNNWVKVQNPDEIFPQMESYAYQVPFYFGGSNVPISLGLDEHKHLTVHSISQLKVKSITGKGVQNTTMSKHDNIRIPRHMSSVRKYI